MSRKALVVIDIQNDITKHYREIIDRINDAIDWAFPNTDYPALYSYCKYTNVPSFRTVRSTGATAASASGTEGSSMPGIRCELTITGKSKP